MKNPLWPKGGFWGHLKYLQSRDWINIPLPHKPYWNRATLNSDYIPFIQKPWALVSKQIWNRFLKTLISVKGYQRSKKYLPTRLTLGAWVWTKPISSYFFWPPTFTTDIFAAPWSKSIFSTSFERSISYLLWDQRQRLLNDF